MRQRGVLRTPQRVRRSAVRTLLIASAIHLVAVAPGSAAQTAPDTEQTASTAPKAEQASPEPSPDSRAERYATFLEISAQNAAQLGRIVSRLPGGPIDGLVGDGSFTERHHATLERSHETITHAGNIPEERLIAHERDTLGYLDRATQLIRLVGELEQSEIAGEETLATALREEIATLASSELLVVLETIAPARLTLTVTDPDEGAVFWPQSFHQMTLTVGNGGDQSAEGVRLTLEPDNSVIASVSSVSGTCAETIDGVWNCDRDGLEPAEQWPLSIAFRAADPDDVPPGPARDVQVSATVTAHKPEIAVEDQPVSFPVAACSANYHRALVDIRDREAATLLTVLKASQNGDRKLSRRWRTLKVSWPKGEVATLSKRTASVVSARGIDPWLARQANGQFVARVVYGLRQYARQDYYRALCTGTETVIRFYRDMLKDFDERRRTSAADRLATALAADAAVARYEDLRAKAETADQTATDQTATDRTGTVQTGTDPGDIDAEGLVKRVAAAAGVELSVFVASEQAPGSETADGADDAANRPTHPVLSALSGLIKADLGDGSRSKADLQTEQPEQAARQALALVEMLYYQDLARGRYQVMARAFDDFFAGVASADAAHCTCRSSRFQLEPTEAAVPVPGITAPKRVRRILRVVPPPRPKPYHDAALPADADETRSTVASTETDAVSPGEQASSDADDRAVIRYERVLDVRSGRYVFVPVY